MKRVVDPGKGAKWNKAHPAGKIDPKALISVAETHEEHLINAYPSLQTELERFKETKVPAAFHISPGRVTGRRLVQLGVPGVCPACGMLEENPNPGCKKHPENSGGGGNSWQCGLAA